MANQAAEKPVPSPAREPAADLGAARHLLNRCAFGPRPGDVERVARLGTRRWLDEQLARPAENPLLEPAMSSLESAYLPPADLVQDWLGDDMPDMSDRRALRARTRPHFKDHLKRLATAELTRHILSHSQLEEVLVDFWLNHFNVYASKGLVRLFEGDYVERAVRPHALGRFEDLLVATARHPAMLLYLDNAESRAPGSTPKRAGRGLNENYARELLELHTLGVDGGYTQGDVTEVARILTGWSLELRGGRLEYRFKPGAHDRGEKRVLGETYPAGQNEEEGLRLLARLADHPATSRNVGRKLCARLVADEPDDDCVERAAAAYRATRGEIAAIVRAVVESPSFAAKSARGAKLKTPVELVASAARALDAIPDGNLALADVLQKLGEPLLQESVPTGYPEGEADWASTAPCSRACALRRRSAAGAPRAPHRLERARAGDTTHRRARGAPFRAPAARRASERTTEIVRSEVALLEQPKARRSAAVALLVEARSFSANEPRSYRFSLAPRDLVAPRRRFARARDPRRDRRKPRARNRATCWSVSFCAAPPTV
jgi:uncharacterized protein (DUF1800 family)